MRAELEDPDNEAISQASKIVDYDDSDVEYGEDGDEANTNEVISNLRPSRVFLAKRTRESIYLTLRLHNLTLTSTQKRRSDFPYSLAVSTTPRSSPSFIASYLRKF